MGRGHPSGPWSLHTQVAAEAHGGQLVLLLQGQGQRHPSRLDTAVVALAFLEFILLSEKHA